MKDLAIYILLTLLSMRAEILMSQDLVSNGGFEKIDSCYGDASSLGFDVFEWSNCENWSCPTYGSSDLWCTNPLFGSYSPPNVGLGYQLPRSGKNMAGLFIFVAHDQTYREYLQLRLLDKLVKGKSYQLDLYVNMEMQAVKNLSSCIQAYFSSNAIGNVNSYGPLPMAPQWRNESDNFISDTLEWTHLSGYYEATGGEEYITIGCFDDSSSLIIEDKDPYTAYGIYYFVDDVSLQELPVSFLFPNVFTPNGDNINDKFEPEVRGVKDFQVVILNRWGQCVARLDEDNRSWDGGEANEGTYFYVLETANKEIRKQGFFQLVR